VGLVAFGADAQDPVAAVVTEVLDVGVDELGRRCRGG
jgi:hypothetical protein